MEIVYWLILFLLIAFSFFKKDSGLVLWVAFVLFVASALLTVFGLRSFAEPIMRVSLIFWLVGIIGAILEYRKEN